LRSADDPSTITAMRHVLVLAGGGGTRLWPASRVANPKQFLPLAPGGESLLAATLRRCRKLSSQIAVVAGHEQRALIAAVDPKVEILSEPAARNTALAFGFGAQQIFLRDPEAVVAAFPADHHIGDEPAFLAVAEQALAIAEDSDVICTIGIRPTHAATGYGYLELEDSAAAGRVLAVRRFVEKPSAAVAETYVASGKHLWNGGMFFVKARRLLAEIRYQLPATWLVLEQIAADLRAGRSLTAESVRLYQSAPSISIDHGVMEKAADVVTLAGDFGWSDIGSWSAVADAYTDGGSANVALGEALVLDGTGNLLSTDPDTLVATVGVSNLVVVRAGNAVLVIPRDRAQEVRSIVDELRRQGKLQFV
jgi:mannose-1-phosphate guanylyltransferase